MRCTNQQILGNLAILEFEESNFIISANALFTLTLLLQEGYGSMTGLCVTTILHHFQYVLLLAGCIKHRLHFLLPVIAGPWFWRLQ